MSLDLDWTKCSTQPDAVAARDKWINIVAYLCLFCGIDAITQKNVAKVTERFAFWERSAGALAGDVEGPVPADVVVAFIGLTTNVPRTSNAQFAKRAFEVATSTAKRRTA